MDRPTLNPIKYDATTGLELLDQRQLPGKMVYEKIDTVEATHAAIKDMKIRGAPAIAVSAMLGVAVDITNAASTFTDVAAFRKALGDKLDYVGTSRPTAVNLHNAVRDAHALIASTNEEAGVEGLRKSFVAFAEMMFAKDVEDNSKISENGRNHLLAHCCGEGEMMSILTHCNTGALASTKYGTALGVIRFVHYGKRLGRVYCTETRPYNQGARLTALECTYEEMPTTLIVDSAVSYLMSTQKVHAVIVGADRVCNNGDTANKVGTYQIAVAAQKHGVPFFVAAPITTLDLASASGASVTIEERSHAEVTANAQTGARVVVESPHLTVWNPSFDLTPGELISGIITEVGVVLPVDGQYDIKKWLAANKSGEPADKRQKTE